MVYNFEKIQINDDLREITVDERVINLEPKVYDLIVFFVKNPSQAISKRDLQEALWPSLEVSETAITRAIMKARKVLADPQESKTYIHTIHGHGYKFIADITTTEQVKESVSQNSAFKVGSKNWTVIGSILLFSFVAVGLIYMSQINTPKNNDRLLVLPIHTSIEDEKLSWVSLGLMSLVSKVIGSSSDVWLVSDKDSMNAADSITDRSQPLLQAQINTLREQLNVRYVLSSELSVTGERNYALSFQVHHDKGVFSDGLLKGESPTALAQLMAKQVADMLPGKITNQNYTAISDDVFTNELYSRGMSFQIQGDADKAQNYFEMAVEEDGQLFAPKFELAVVKRKQNKLDEALADFKYLLANLNQYGQSPLEEIQLLNSMGTTYLRKLENEKAIQYYNQAHQLAEQHEAYGMVATTAYNMAIIERREQNLEAARGWATKSLATMKKHHIKAAYSVWYLIGQIERDSGNLDKAIELFTQSYAGYVKSGKLRHAASVMSATARLLQKKGRYQQALDKLVEAKSTKLKLNDKIGLVDVELSQLGVYIAMEQETEARQALDHVWAFAREHDLKSRYNTILKEEVALDFAEHRYGMVVEKINTQGKDIKSKNLDMLKLKSLQQLGDAQVIANWLDEYAHYLSGENNMMKMYWLDFQNYYLLFHGDFEALMISYQQRLALSRLMGNDALSVKLLLKMGYQNLKHERPGDAQITLNDMLSYDLNWWQIDMFQALLAGEAGQNESALKALELAREKAGSAWKEKHETLFKQMNQNAELVFEEVLLF